MQTAAADSSIHALAESVAFHAVALADGDLVEVELLRSGVHRPRVVGGRPASGPGTLAISEDMIDSLVRGFYAAKGADHFVGGGAPVGYEHQELEALNGAGSIDAAEVKRLAATFADVRKRTNADGTYSLVGSLAYTEEGRAKVRGGEFRGFSLVFLPPGAALDSDGAQIPEYVPIGGTLTNRPFVRTMEPVAASEVPAESTPEEIQTMDIKLVRDTLALSEDATEAQALAALHTLTEKAAKVDALTERADVLTSEVKALTEERDEAKAQIAALSERDKVLTIRQAVADGRISKSQEDRYWRVLSALGEEEAHAIFPAGGIPTVSEVPAAKPGEADDEGDDVNALFESIYIKALSESGDERKAYRVADEATRDLRNKTYGA